MIGPFAICLVAAAEAAPAASDFAGYYEGNQMEMAAGLELGADGRFQYGLAYGALNEEAEGVWVKDGNRILLTSDPVNAPEFRLAEQLAEPEGELNIALQPPSGLPVQLFHLIILFADGEHLDYSFRGEEETFPFDASRRPVSVQLALPMFGILSPTIELPKDQGQSLRFVFEPNDLGKVGFASTPLVVDAGDLMLQRHDRQIRFRRVAGAGEEQERAQGAPQE
jgi:hypothetical protein